MDAFGAVAFLNLGLPEAIVIGLLALLLFGPRLGRTLGNVGGTLLHLKRDVDEAKSGVRRHIEREIDDAIRGGDEDNDGPPAPASP